MLFPILLAASSRLPRQRIADLHAPGPARGLGAALPEPARGARSGLSMIGLAERGS